MDFVEAQQHCRALSERQEHARRQENGEQAWRQTRNASLRLRRPQKRAEQLEKHTKTDKDSDWPRPIRQPLLT